MSIRNTNFRYGSVSRFFHWAIFLLVFCMLIVGYFAEDISKPLRGGVINIHKLIGLLILALMVLRALWACTNVKPLPVAGTLFWQRWAERAVHYSLYAVLFIIPISGWVMTVAKGHPPMLGSIAFNLPIAENRPLSELGFTIHSWVAALLIGLVCIHLFAALYHHYLKNDDVLKRMLPEKE